MTTDNIFGTGYISDHDTATERVCGCCGELKPVSEFYRDGKDNNGKVRYRRDCKDCYKIQRNRDAEHKNGGKHNG